MRPRSASRSLRAASRSARNGRRPFSNTRWRCTPISRIVPPRKARASSYGRRRRSRRTRCRIRRCSPISSGSPRRIRCGLSPAGTFIKKYDKHILVPFAEYLPFEHALRGLPLFGEASHFSSGPGPALFDAAGFSFGPLVCYESAFAPYAREIANAGADVLVIVTDDAWFGDTSGPYQHAEMSVVDAVETGRWVVRGGDTGISEIIDPKGRVVQSLGLSDTSGVLGGEVGKPIDAPYVRWGIWWLLVVAGATLAWGLYPRRRIAHGWRSRRGRA